MLRSASGFVRKNPPRYIFSYKNLDLTISQLRPDAYDGKERGVAEFNIEFILSNLIVWKNK